MDQEYLYTKLKNQEQSLQSLLDDLYTSAMQKVDELKSDINELKNKYQL